MLRTAIVFAVANYPLTLLVIGLVVSLVQILRTRRPIGRAVVIESLLSWYLLFNVGLMYLINFVFHVFFGTMAASFIGWADSPFQLEVGFASLGFSLGGFLAAFGSSDRRLVAVIGPSIFTLGAAAGHIHQMVSAHNFAPGNAGPIFYTDIIVPLLGFALLWLQHRERRAAAA